MAKINKGGYYHIPVEILDIGDTGHCRARILGTHSVFRFAPNETAQFSPIIPENGIKNTEPTPKYDPNRKFRKGDIVKPCQVKGRWQSITWKGRSGIHFTVTEDEDEDGIVSIKDPDCKLPSITSAVFLELVTPVEELEPYIVVDAHTHWDVADKNVKTVAMYSKGLHPNAKAAAEAERDRLNDEWRKEQSND